jgi:hypothetical protein
MGKYMSILLLRRFVMRGFGLFNGIVQQIVNSNYSGQWFRQPCAFCEWKLCSFSSSSIRSTLLRR